MMTQGKYEIIHNAIKRDNNLLSISRLCEIAGVSRSGYYAWEDAAPIREKREESDQTDFGMILKAYKFRGYAKGARGIFMRLLHMGQRMNLKKIRRLMRKYGLKCPFRRPNPYRQMAKAIKTNSVFPNVVDRKFDDGGVRKVLLTDITYIFYDRGVCYLSTILDAFTHEILAYELSPNLMVDFVLQTVDDLVIEYGCTLDDTTIIHSDQGCHYTSIKFISLVQDLGLRQSMSRRGNCWDNAPQESFFGHMKDELNVKAKNWRSFKEVQEAIDDWMDYYNNDRYKECLGKLSPNEFYNYITTGEYPSTMLH